MNVFEFLGLSKDHRKSNKVVQLVKHIQEVPVSKIKFPLYAQVKKDGVFCMLVSFKGKVGIFGRTGMMLTSSDTLLDKWKYLEEGVYIGELCNDSCSLEALSGIVNPNRVKALSKEQELLVRGMYVSFHDHLFLEEFVSGVSNRTYYKRWDYLTHGNSIGCLSVLPINLVHSMQEAEALAHRKILSGEEGAVFKNTETGYLAGHKGYHAMKIVRGVDYDLLCIGYEEGKGKYTGKVANLIFQWKNGETIKAMLGKGWTHEDAGNMLDSINYQGINKDLYPIGKVFKVHALQESSKGKLRLPKVLEMRIDKETPDV